MVYTSDVEGPSLEEQADFVLQEDPDLLILDGPMTYMLGYRYSQESLTRSVENINKIIRDTKVETIIADHHLLRDLNYKERLADVYKCADENAVRVLNAAEYLGQEAEMLEARRKELYAKDGSQVLPTPGEKRAGEKRNASKRKVAGDSA